MPAPLLEMHPKFLEAQEAKKAQQVERVPLIVAGGGVTLNLPVVDAELELEELEIQDDQNKPPNATNVKKHLALHGAVVGYKKAAAALKATRVQAETELNPLSQPPTKKIPNEPNA